MLASTIPSSGLACDQPFESNPRDTWVSVLLRDDFAAAEPRSNLPAQRAWPLRCCMPCALHFASRAAPVNRRSVGRRR